jgi:xylan 1,4-beta-xylosidase
MMFRRVLLALAAILASPAVAGDAVFRYFSYAGSDPVEAVLPLKPGYFRNPIIPGFHPDPSIVRVGKDYYLVNSTFAFYPGLPIFRSRDLVNWTQIGNAIDRPDMFDFSGLGVARAVFSPTIRYHGGQFYIVNTCIECGFNFIISAKDPAGPWSTPAFLPAVDGIDPDLFFDDDGRVWISNNGPPVGTPRYDGHRAIWIQEFDLKTMTMIGPRTVVVDGGVKPAEKPIWTEGPHIFKRDGYYFLIAAEGGTAGNHSETVFRSRKVTGPYAPGPINPILTQRDLDPKRPFSVYATGHADFVQATGGKWWAVFLGTRPYEANLSNMGRETFLLPVTWPKGGWPNILPPKTRVPQILSGITKKSGSARWRDDFAQSQLALDWLMLRTPKEKFFDLTPGGLALTPRAVTLSGSGNPSFLAKRQSHANASVETEMRYTPDRSGDHAGLVAFADEQHHYFVGLWQSARGARMEVRVRSDSYDADEGRILVSQPYLGKPGAPIRLKISAKGAAYDFGYAEGDGAWHNLVVNADGRVLASEPTNQFTGTVIGVFAGRTAE